MDIARKCWNLEKLIVEGEFVPDEEMEDKNIQNPFLYVKLYQIQEILNELSVNEKIKYLQIENICLTKNKNDVKLDLDIKDVKDFACKNLLPIIESRFPKDSYIKIVILEPNHPKLLDKDFSELEFVLLEKEENEKPELEILSYDRIDYI